MRARSWRPARTERPGPRAEQTRAPLRARPTACPAPAPWCAPPTRPAHPRRSGQAARSGPSGPGSWPCASPAWPPGPWPTASAGRFAAVPLAVLLRHAGHLGRDLGPPRGEHDLGRLGHASDLEPVAVLARDQDITQVSEPRRQLPRRVRGHRQALLVTASAPCSVRHLASAWSPRWARFMTAMWTWSWGSPSRDVCCRNMAATEPAASRYSVPCGPGPHVQSALHPSDGRPSGRTAARP